MSTFNFEYIPFVLIDEEQKNVKLSEIIFNSKKEEKIVKCHFFGGKEKKCNIEIKINEFAYILIIIINDKVKNFQIKTFLSNQNLGIYFSLFCFIEKNTNNVYVIKNDICFKYNENYQIKKVNKREIDP